MILNRPNEEFVYNGISYRIGDRIIGTDSSEYHGLLGSITEIRDGDDKTTENETPDIYCRFDVPIFSYEILELEKRFSELYQCKKTIDDIALDEVIMAPEMIQTLRDLDSRQRAFDIYMISEDWAVNGASGHSVFFCTDLDMAKRILRAYYNDDSILLPGILIKRSLKRSIFIPFDSECGFDYQYVTEKECIIRYDKKSYAEFYKKTYSPGTRIVLLSPKNGIDLSDPAIQAHVVSVDSIGLIHCQLNDGRTVELVPGIDSFRIVGNND